MEKIWYQAQADLFSTRLTTNESVSYIFKGIKIEKKESDIRIYNTKLSSGFYTELTDEEYEVFLLRGWRIGCYMMSLSNYRRSLDIISKKIVLEINGRKNQRHYATLKESRNNIMNRLTLTLKQLQHEAKRELQN